MKPSVQNLYAKAKEAHEILYMMISQIRKEIEACNNFVELCDYAFAVDQTHDFIKDTKEELWKFKETIVKKVDELWLSEAIRNPGTVKRSIHTDYVTATPDIKQAPNIPSQKSNPEAYKALMDYLGIDISTWPKHEEGGKSEVVKIHWPGLVNLVSEKIAAGLPCPPGIDISKLTPVYKLTLRKKRDVLADPEHEPSVEEMQDELAKLNAELDEKF